MTSCQLPVNSTATGRNSIGSENKSDHLVGHGMDAYVISNRPQYERARAKPKLRLVRASNAHAQANRLHVRRLSS